MTWKRLIQSSFMATLGVFVTRGMEFGDDTYHARYPVCLQVQNERHIPQAYDNGASEGSRDPG